MLHRTPKLRMTLFALMAALNITAVGIAQTKPPAKTTTTKPATPVKVAPAKPAPAQTAVRPNATATRAVPARPAVSPGTGRPAMPTSTLGSPAATTRNVAAPLNASGMQPGRSPVVTNGGIAPNGKGAVIGSAVGGVRGNALSTTGTAPVSVKGRPPIPGTTQTRGVVAAPAGRPPIPGTTSNMVVPASSSSYINSPGSGRPPIPSYGSAAPVTAGSGQAQAIAGPNGSLGQYQYGSGMLTIYGCARQGNQIICDTDFNNQNQNQTMVNTQWWRDMYVVDAFGDRHQRGSAYFVNGAGEPRETLDVPYGQSARYIMVFNDVPANAPTVSLHSPYGNINIENIGLDGGGAVAQGGEQAAQAPAAGSNVVADTTNGMKENVKNSGKQRAGEARDKAINKANDSLQNLMNKIPK